MKIKKERSIKTARSGFIGLITLTIWMMTALNGQAQFHQRSSKGGTTSRQQSNTPAPSGVDMRGWSYGEMDVRKPEVWGRAIIHPNGNYTESKLDQSQRTLQQFTYQKKNRDSDRAVLLQKRIIKLDASGRPIEVLIYDVAGQLTNRGVLIYDRVGRFIEESLFDTSNQLVRRKIQTYAADGRKLPLRIFNYGKSQAGDVDLMITRESVQKEGQAAETKKKKSFLKKLRFWKKKDKR